MTTRLAIYDQQTNEELAEFGLEIRPKITICHKCEFRGFENHIVSLQPFRTYEQKEFCYAQRKWMRDLLNEDYDILHCEFFQEKSTNIVKVNNKELKIVSTISIAFNIIFVIFLLLV